MKKKKIAPVKKMRKSTRERQKKLGVKKYENFSKTAGEKENMSMKIFVKFLL